MRKTITPGRLYFLLSGEFHRLRPGHCSACRMPLPELVEPSLEEETPNWMVGTIPSGCESCAPVIQEIIERHQALYDVHDPISRPMRRKPAPSEMPATRH